MNDFDDFQKRQSDIYPSEKSLEYLTLRLVAEVGQLAREASLIVRGDHESKGAIVQEMVTDRVMSDCNRIITCVTLIATVLEKKLSEIIEHQATEKRDA